MDEVGVVLTQLESTDTAGDGDVSEKSAVTEKESTDAATANTGAVEGDEAAPGDKGTDNAVEGGDQSTSSDAYADFTLPEGVTLDTVALEKYSPLLKELNLSQEQAQKLVSARAEEVQASQQAQVEAFNQLKQDWQKQSKDDKEIGGDNFDKSVSDAREALSKFGTPGLTKLLDDFGIGNHPEMIRFAAKVGALTLEDVPGSTGAPSMPERDRISILYPSDSKN